MLNTELTRRLQIQHPVIQAGMGEEARAELAAAVSNAGGLGTIGSIGGSPDHLREQIRQCKEATTKPFSVNLVTFDWAPFAAQLLEIVIQERVPVVTLSFGNPLPGLERCQAEGLKTIVQVQDVAGARAVLKVRPDVLVVQGNEAGGHTGRRGTLSFAAQVLDIAEDVPVVVAGGVADGRGLAAALAMGAAGAVLGTRFKATNEYATPRWQKEAIVTSDGSNTLYDEILDLAYGLVWPNQIIGRALQNRFTDEWTGRNQELKAAVTAEAQPFSFVQQLAKSPETGINWAGESSGLVTQIMPAAQVVAEVVRQAETLLLAVAKLTGP